MGRPISSYTKMEAWRSYTLIAFMVWEGAEPSAGMEEMQRRRDEQAKARADAWADSQLACTNLKQSAEDLYDANEIPQGIASGMLIAHFTYLCFNCSPKSSDTLKPPAHFRLKRLSEVPRPPARHGVDLADALMSGHVVMETCTGNSFGKDSLRLKLRSNTSQDLQIAVRRGTIFQHIDWVHRQNLIVSVDYVVNVPAGGFAWKKMESYCINNSCCCSSGQPMTLTEFYFEDLDVMESQGKVWDHFEAVFTNGAWKPSES